MLFLFHRQSFKTFKPLVQPPRLGGRKTVGVYATRSPNRPNPVGMSAVRLEAVEQSKGKLCLHIRGGDFLDGTPVLDVKPYIAYADAIAADSTWAVSEEDQVPVEWSAAATAALEHNSSNTDVIRSLITETIAQDPRPAHERGKDGQEGQEWNMQISDFSVFWAVEAGTAIITRMVRRSPLN